MNREFKATFIEKIMAVLIFVLSYVYLSAFCESEIVCRVLMGVFVLGFVAFGEVLYRSRKRTVESSIFLCFTILIAIAYCFNIGKVWDELSKVFFLHLYAVYWVLVRSDSLAEGETSHLFAFDGLTGFAIMPFTNYPLGLETIGSIFAGVKTKDKKRIIMTLAAIAVGGILFISAMSFLKDSDANFKAIMSIFEFEFNWEYFWRFVFSIFIGLYLYGLFGGCLRTDRAEIRGRGSKLNAFILRLNKIPGFIWVMFIALFSVFYIVFFLLQGSYLFDALSMILPENYTFSQNAHKGFDDMCAVMVINFVLMWLTARTGEKKSAALKIAGAVLMAESLMFALIAFLKLYMYIKVYGFTPLRLQSVWLVLVLAYACVCILISLFTKKKTGRLWFIGSAASLSILMLI